MTTNSAEDEQILIRQLRSGDDRVFADLVQRWTPAMLRLADHYLPSREVSEEVVQDAWIAVIQGLAAFEGRSTLRTWVFHILVRRAQQTGIRERRSVPFSAVWRQDAGEPAAAAAQFHPDRAAADALGWIDPPPRWTEVPDQRWEGVDLGALIRLAIATLPRRQAEVITAMDLQGCSAQEACEILGLSLNNQRVLLHRARSGLRLWIDTHAPDYREGSTQAQSTRDPLPF